MGDVVQIRDYQKVKPTVDKASLSQLAVDVMNAALKDTAPSEMIPYHTEDKPA